MSVKKPSREFIDRCSHHALDKLERESNHSVHDNMYVLIPALARVFFSDDRALFCLTGKFNELGKVTDENIKDRDVHALILKKLDEKCNVSKATRNYGWRSIRSSFLELYPK